MKTVIELEHYDVIVTGNEQGVIIDVYSQRTGELIKTDTHWNDDACQESEE